jgi:hypothetical protein
LLPPFDLRSVTDEGTSMIAEVVRTIRGRVMSVQREKERKISCGSERGGRERASGCDAERDRMKVVG